MSRILLGLGLLCLTMSASLPAADVQQPQILVFAAASLTDALQEVSAAYEKTVPVTVKSSFDSSSVLARQIEAGAPADVFFSADTKWMDYLQSRNLIQAASRKNLLVDYSSAQRGRFCRDCHFAIDRLTHEGEVRRDCRTRSLR